ncbi:MAG: hypothetical protein IPL11_02245 [Candidatus Accumulibacter sp.]|nr:hypothetical protein [Accumulibacter sp.]
MQEAVGQVLRTQVARFDVLGGTNPELLVSFPIRFPYTKDVIGILFGRLDLQRMLQRAALGVSTEHGISLLGSDGAVLLRTAGPDAKHYFPEYFRLQHPESLRRTRCNWNFIRSKTHFWHRSRSALRST